MKIRIQNTECMKKYGSPIKDFGDDSMVEFEDDILVPLNDPSLCHPEEHLYRDEGSTSRMHKKEEIPQYVCENTALRNDHHLRHPEGASFQRPKGLLFLNAQRVKDEIPRFVQNDRKGS